MLKFSEYIEKILEADTLSDFSSGIPPAKIEPLTLSQTIEAFIKKYKNGNVISPSGSTIMDNLNLKVTNYEVNQKIKINTQQGTYIDAIISKGNKGQKRTFKLIDTSIEGVNNLIKPQSQANIMSPSGAKVPSQKKNIYFYSYKGRQPNETKLKFVDQSGNILMIIKIIIANIQTNF